MKELDIRETESVGESDELQWLKEELAASASDIASVREALSEARGEGTGDTTALMAQVAKLEETLSAEKKRAKEQWKWSCSQVSDLDALVASR